MACCRLFCRIIGVKLPVTYEPGYSGGVAAAAAPSGRWLLSGRIIIIIFNLMRGRRRGHSTIFAVGCLLFVVVVFVLFVFLLQRFVFAARSCPSHFLLPFASWCFYSAAAAASFFPCTLCNATLYAAVDAFRGFCVYAMLSPGIPNAKGHRQPLWASTISPLTRCHPVYWHMCIGICFVDFPQHAVPICLVGQSSYPPPIRSRSRRAAQPGVKVQTWRKVVSTNRSGQHLHLHFHLPLYSFSSISISIRNVPGLPFYA